MTRTPLLVASLLVLAPLHGCTDEPGASTATPVAAAGTATTGAMTVIDAASRPNFLDDFKGRVVLIDFWATWCPPCKQAMPGVQALHERFQGRPVTILGVNCWERGDPVAYMNENKFTYGLVLKGDALAKEHAVEGIPTFILLDFEGNVLTKQVGYDPANEQKLGDMIEKYLVSRGS